MKVKRHAIYITRNTSAGVTASREQQQQQQQQQQLVLLAAKCSTEKERQTDREKKKYWVRLWINSIYGPVCYELLTEVIDS